MSEERQTSGGLEVFLNRALLAIWSLWWTVVFTTNLADAAKALGLLGERWAFASGNLHLVIETTARYNPPSWLSGLLFLGVLAWQGTTACLFWRACWWVGREGMGERATRLAFTVGFTLWGAFLIADEICLAYSLEGTHMRVLIAQMVTLLVLERLAEGTGSPAD